MLAQVIQVVRIHPFHCVACQRGILHRVTDDLQFPSVVLGGDIVDQQHECHDQSDKNEDRGHVFFVDSHYNKSSLYYILI